MLYYEASTKSHTVDPAKLNAVKHAAENRGLAKGHLDKFLTTTNSDVDDKEDLLDKMLARLRAAPLTKNIPPAVLGFLTASPDFKTCWQLANSKDSPGGTLPEYDNASYAEKREMAERKVGYRPFTKGQRENRPDYVGINITNNPKGAAPNYGRWFFEFKDSVKSRVTFTARDTFSHISDLKNVSSEKSIGTHENMETTLAYNEGAVKVLASLVLDMKKSENEIIRMMPFYIEGQVHGGLAVSDIATVVVDLPSDEKSVQDMDKGDFKVLQAFLKKYPGVAVRYKS
jgi:hypothetical protein